MNAAATGTNSNTFTIAQATGSQAGAHMLPKPFSKKTLLLAVAQLLHWKENDEKLVPLRAWGNVTNSIHPPA